MVNRTDVLQAAQELAGLARQERHALLHLDLANLPVSCRRCGSDSTRVKYVDGQCVSTAACTKRLRERVGIRLELETVSPLDDDTRQAIANIKESARRIKEIRNIYHKFNLCVDCGVAQHSPGRLRCESCHHSRT